MMDKDMLIAFLWDQVKRLSQWTRQRDGEVQKGYSNMCKLENKGMIPHLVEEKVEEAHEAIGADSSWNSTNMSEDELALTQSIPIPDPVPEVVEEVVEESVEEVVEEILPEPEPPKIEVVDPAPQPIESDNVDDLLEQYKKKLQKD